MKRWSTAPRSLDLRCRPGTSDGLLHWKSTPWVKSGWKKKTKKKQKKKKHVTSKKKTTNFQRKKSIINVFFLQNLLYYEIPTNLWVPPRPSTRGGSLVIFHRVSFIPKLENPMKPQWMMGFSSKSFLHPKIQPLCPFFWVDVNPLVQQPLCLVDWTSRVHKTAFLPR